MATEPTEPAPHPAALIEQGTAAGAWKLEPAESHVEFTAKTFYGLATVKGRFSGVSGQAHVSEDGHVSAEVAIDAASVSTGNKKRDQHLRSSDFFHIEQHPQLTLAVDEVSFTDPHSVTAGGTLTAGGASIPVTFQATIAPSPGGDRAAVDAAIEVERAAVGMTFNQLGMMSKTARGTAHLVFARS